MPAIIDLTIPDPLYNETISSAQIVASNMKSYIIPLSKEDKLGMARISENALGFVNEAVQYMEANPTLCPSYCDVNIMKTDLKTADQIDNIYHTLDQTAKGLNDTMILLRSQVYRLTLAFYHSLEIQVKLNIPGAKEIYNALKVKFENFGPQEELETTEITNEVKEK